MGHNGVVMSYMISTDIPWVDGLSTNPRILGHHIYCTSIQFGKKEKKLYEPFLLFKNINII